MTFYDTIEHIADPLAALIAAGRLLAPGGLLHAVTPNVDGLQARVLGRRWYHYKPDEHLFYFSPRTLRRLVERAGLRWEGWARTGSYVTLSYVLDRLRVYSPLFRMLGRASRSMGIDGSTFYLSVGEMEAWARRPDPSSSRVGATEGRAPATPPRRSSGRRGALRASPRYHRTPG